jgi:hypothetical protein
MTRMPSSDTKTRLYTTDFVKITIVYRDTKTGRFIGKSKAEKIKEKEPHRIRKETRMILKKKPKGLKVKGKRGKPLSKKEYIKISEHVRRHNMALAIAVRDGISYNEAMKKLKRAEKLYKAGLITSIGFKREIGS